MKTCRLILIYTIAFLLPLVMPAQQTTEKAKTYTEILDVKYGDAPGQDNLLDAYLPLNRNSHTKVIVYIHGGSWIQGNKKELPAALIEELAGKRKYAVVSVNYRLVKDGKNTFPAQIEDIRKALDFITENAETYSYDGNHFTLMGASAGAHLALLYAYGYDMAKKVKTVIDIFGPTDLADMSVRGSGMESNETITNFLGTSDINAAIVAEASPYNRLTKNTGVPTIIFHGTADELVHVSQSEKLHKKLQELQISSQLELYPGEKHEMRPVIGISVFAKIIAWLQKYYPVEDNL